MDIKKTFTKLLSPETYTERGVFIALGIFCIDRALFLLANSYNTYLRISLAIFSVAIGVIVLVKFGRKFKSSILIKGLFGLGLWLIADGLFLVIPSMQRLFSNAFSFGVGMVLMVGFMERGSVKKEMGLFLLGFYFLLSMTSGMTSGWGYNYYIFFRFAHPILLLVSGVLLIFGRSDESIVGDDVLEDISNIK